MNIHNVYSDLMLALANYINSILPIKIKNFQFNLANTSFNLNLSPQYELPSAIINFESANPQVNHPYVNHRNFGNKNQLPVLYNETKDIDLILQEELYNVSINFIINCESQLQALNINHALIGFLPTNKFFQLFDFISFCEIDSILLNKFLFDTDNDKIHNLFLKHNRYSDSMDYCFSISYSPILKLNSSNIDISNITSSSFQVSNSFSALIQLPIFIKTSNIDLKSNILPNSKKLYYNNIQVGTINKPYILLQLKNQSTNISESQIIPILDIGPDGKFTVDFQYGELFGSFSNKKIIYKCDLQYNNKYCNIDIIEEHNYIKSTTKYLINGDFSGQLKNVSFLLDTIECWFDGLFENRLLSDKLKFSIRSSYIEYQLQQFNVSLSGYDLLNYTLVNNIDNDITNFIPNINKYASRLNLKNSSVYAVLIYDNGYKTILLDDPVALDNNPVTIRFNYNSVNYSLLLKIKQNNLSVSSNNNINLIALNFNKLEFDYIKNLHPGYSEKISIDFNYNNELIGIAEPFHQYGELLFTNISKILDTIDSTFIPNTRQFEITLPTNSTKWKIIHNKGMISSGDVNISSSKLLIDENLYMTFFNNISKINPAYLIEEL